MQVSRENYIFFPLNRAMSLTDPETDNVTAETKEQSIAQQLHAVMRRLDEQVMSC